MITMTLIMPLRVKLLMSREIGTAMSCSLDINLRERQVLVDTSMALR
jgi:hypothetical protein